MSPVRVRSFQRRDRDQLAGLVTAHAAAVIPGARLSVAALLSHLEREPGEFIVDPWVAQRVTLVAEQDNRIAAAAHLLRYRSDSAVGADYRGSGEIRWLVFWPEGPAAGSPWWTAGTQAAGELVTACLAQLAQWHVTSSSAGGELPVSGVYGVPEQWPHVSALYQDAGFVHAGQTEAVYLARVADLPRPASPVDGLEVRRTVGLNGTRLSAVRDGEAAGYIEVAILAGSERLDRQAGWADVGNLHVSERFRRQKVATWLLGRAADWLELAGVDRLLGYLCVAGPDGQGQDCGEGRAFLESLPVERLTTTRRGWTR